MADDHVIAKISADLNELKTDLQKGLGEFKTFGEKVQRSVPEDPFAKLKDGVKDLGQIFAAAAPFVKSGQQAAQFEADLRSLNTITGLSDDALQRYGESLRTVSMELKTAQGASASAQAAFAIAGSGFEDAAEAAEVLETTLKATTAGGMKDAAPVAETLSGALKAYGANSRDAERFANVMFATIRDGITTFPELTATMGNVAPIASAAGISFEELGAAIAVTTGKGIKTATAVDGIKGAITNLLAPSEQARKELERLGVTVTESSLKQKGLKNTLLEIAKANGGSAQSFKLVLGDVQAFNAAIALTSDGGTAFEKAMNNMANSTGALDGALAERNKTFQASMDQFKVALEAAGVAVGTVFLPVAKQLLDGVTGIVAAFASAPAPIRDVITVVGAMGAATIITSKAITLLTTAAQREVLAMGASSAAKVLNTNVSVALTAGVIKTQIAFNGLAARAATVSLSMTGMSAAFATARTATLGLTASLAPLLIAGAGVILLANSLADAWTESAKSLGEYETKAGKVSAGIDDAFKSAGMSAAELAKAGKSVADLNGELEALRQAAETVKNTGLAPADEAKKLDKIAKAVMHIKGERSKLAEIEKQAAQSKANEPETVGDARNREESEKKANAAAEKAARDAETSRKEALAADLHAIEVKKKRGELSARQEIKALEVIKNKRVLMADEVRDIESKQAQAQGEIQKANEATWKKSADLSKEAAKKSLDLKSAALESDLEAAKTIEDRLDLEKQLVDLEARKALMGEKNVQLRKAILDNAKAEKKLLEDQAKEAADKRDADMVAKRADLVKEQASEEEAAQQATFDKRRKQLDDLAAAGKNVHYDRIKLQEEELAAADASSKKRLENIKAEIAAKQAAADVGATPEEKILNADQAALELKKAERQASSETQDIWERGNATLLERLKYLREQLELQRKAKEEARGPSFSGETYGAESLNENRAGLGVSRRKRGATNEDGMTEADIEAEIARSEGVLNSRTTKRAGAGAPMMNAMGVSRSAREKAEAEAAAAPKNEAEVQTSQLEVQKALLAATQETNKLLAAGGGRGRGGFQPSRVPTSLLPNSSFT